MQIIKVINNNVISSEDDKGKEIVVMGKGIGFGKKAGEEIEETKIERCQPDILIRMSGNAYDMLEFHHAESIVATGIEITRNALDRIGVTSQEG